MAPVLTLIGCGAIADAFHLPALSRMPEVTRQLILVDPDLDRAEAVRRRLGAARAVTDYRDVLEETQGAIVATPHHLHRPITLDLIAHGAHVLCEKPLAETPGEVDDIVDRAAQRGVHVLVNHTRRLYSSLQAVKRDIVRGALGELREIDCVLGEPFAWPATTGSYFGAKHGGKGVLFDTGAHIIDLVCWMLGGEPELTDYRDDSHGGTEAVAVVSLCHGPTRARVHLSWLSKLRNEYRFVGSEGSVVVGAYEWSSYHVHRAGRADTVRTDRTRPFDHLADKLLRNFVAVVAGHEGPVVSAHDVRASVAVIDACYARRQRFPEPWHDACQVLADV